ncbi:ABC transporter permease [Pontibacter anaerobius]|uniref:ABC transporter permease n=1 Tax=Pontibacter anaerobius TaxID=2993940 RepID=A0ABT3RE73_9BACT|nr:ABC transporter permease [Pontibacter anaerobius]MCX2739924.1 ABC transporter permease [Pontibacter anaerobius]
MNLIRVELHKMLPYRTVWAILAIFVVLMLLILYAGSEITINGQELGEQMYDLPKFWQILAYIASFFNMLFGVLLIVLVTDEYTFRTLRQQVIDGMSRAELVLAKFYVVLGLGAFATVFLLVLGLYFGLLHGQNHSANAVFGQIDHLSYYYVQTVGYMTLAMLFGFLIRKSGLAIVAFIAYTIVVEPIIHFRLPDSVDKFMPVKALKSLTPMPGQEVLDQLTTPSEALPLPWAVLISLVYIGLFWFLSYFTLKLRDL